MKRNLLLGMFIGAGMAAGQARVEVDPGNTPDLPPPAYKAKITKAPDATVITSEDDKVTVLVYRRDLIKPKVILANWVEAPDGYIYTYTVENDQSAKQPIDSKEGPIAPGKTGTVSFYSPFPPGMAKVKFGAPVDVALELKQPSIPDTVDPRFLEAVEKTMRENHVEVDTIGPVEPVDVPVEP
jgi:hypothetical protein